MREFCAKKAYSEFYHSRTFFHKNKNADQKLESFLVDTSKLGDSIEKLNFDETHFTISKKLASHNVDALRICGHKY